KNSIFWCSRLIFCTFLDERGSWGHFQRFSQAINPITAGFEVLTARFVVEPAGFVAAAVGGVVLVLPVPVLESCCPAGRLRVAGRAAVVAVAAVAAAESEVPVAVHWLLPPRQHRDRLGSTPLGSEVVRHWRHCSPIHFQMPG